MKLAILLVRAIWVRPARLKDDGVTLALSNVASPVLDMFERTGLLGAVGDEVYKESATAVAAHAGRTGDTPRTEDLTAEAAAGLAELADLVADEEVTGRLSRAIEALEPDRESWGTRHVGAS